MSASLPSPEIFAAFIVAFAVLWVVSGVAIRQRGGFTTAAARQYGALGSRPDGVRWCSAQIAGVAFNGCLHVSRVPGGYLFQISRLFFGGGRFISDAEIAAMATAKTWLRVPTLAGQLANGDQFTAWGKLAAYLIAGRAASPPTTDKPT